ncbi:MAG: hypothetical protein ACUVXI_09240 [bacterium]
MAEVTMPHVDHEKHLCYLHNISYLQRNFNDYKDLVKDAKFVCRNCGRASASSINLCYPEKL